jgi:iron complex transport system substrate-binding protein
MATRGMVIQTAFFHGLCLLLLAWMVPVAMALTEHVDQLGRRCLIPDAPKRVISLAPSITEIVCALGRESLLKGVTRFSDYPPSIHDLPKVGSYIRLDLERIVSLSPDLCIGIKDGNPRETVLRLETMGIPVFVVDPHDLNSVISALTDIGTVLGAKDRAAWLVRDFTDRIQHVKAFTDHLKHRPRVFFQIGVAPIVSVGRGTFLDELIRLSGADNLAGITPGYPRFSMEEVLHLNPDVIIITSMARGQIFEEVKKQWSSWPDLAAVRQNRVHIVDSDVLDRPTPRLVSGLEMLTALIHPSFVPLSRHGETLP